MQPTLLDKEDELRRLSELQKRDSLVRGLGIPEILHCMFADSRTKISSEDGSVSDDACILHYLHTPPTQHL